MPEVAEDKFAALKAARENGYPIEFWGNDSPKCPHCGFICNIERMDAFHLKEEGIHDLECPECGVEFLVTTRMSFTYSTDQQGSM